MLSFHPLSSQEALLDAIIREGLLCEGVLEEDTRQQYPKTTASARPLCLLINRGGPARESGMVFSTSSVCQNKSGELTLEDGVRT